MKLLSIIIAAAALSGAAYGQLIGDNLQRMAEQGNREEAARIEARSASFQQELNQRAREFQARMREEQAQQQQLERLEEIQAQQRQIRSEIFQRELFEERRCRPQPFWFRPLELECE